MAEGGDDNLDELSNRLEKVHLDLMDEADDYVWVGFNFSFPSTNCKANKLKSVRSTYCMFTW